LGHERSANRITARWDAGLGPGEPNRYTRAAQTRIGIAFQPQFEDGGQPGAARPAPALGGSGSIPRTSVAPLGPRRPTQVSPGLRFPGADHEGDNRAGSKARLALDSSPRIRRGSATLLADRDSLSLGQAKVSPPLARGGGFDSLTRRRSNRPLYRAPEVGRDAGRSRSRRGRTHTCASPKSLARPPISVRLPAPARDGRPRCCTDPGRRAPVLTWVVLNAIRPSRPASAAGGPDALRE